MSYADRETSRSAGSPIELFKFTMGGVVQGRWSSGDSSDTIQDPDDFNLYTPAAISRAAQDFSNEDDQANVEIVVPWDNPVALLFVGYAPPAPVMVEIRRHHRGDDELVVVLIGEVIAMRFEDAGAVLVCAPIGQRLNRQIPALVYQSQCNWAFGSEGCGVDVDALADAGVTLSSVDGVTLVSATFATHPDGWFRAGLIERASGDRRMVVAHVGNTLTLISPFIGLTTAETVTAKPGCNHTEPACIAFSNIANHLGFPRIPVRNPYGGNRLVTLDTQVEVVP